MTVTQEEKNHGRTSRNQSVGRPGAKNTAIKNKDHSKRTIIGRKRSFRRYLALKEELGKQHLAFYNQNTQATLECKQYESDLKNLSNGEIPDDLLAKVETEKDEKLQPLVAAYQSGRSGSYFSPAAWSNWYSLDAAKKILMRLCKSAFKVRLALHKGRLKKVPRPCGIVNHSYTPLRRLNKT